MTDKLQLLRLLAARDCADTRLQEPDVKPQDGVLCRCCGETFTLLKRHLQNAHSMDEATYRFTYAIPDQEALVSVGYSAMKRRCVTAYAGAALSAIISISAS